MHLLYPDFLSLDHHEDDLVSIKRPKDEGPDGDFDLQQLFFKDNDIWKCRRFDITCEFCNCKCDRLNYMDDIAEAIDFINEVDLPNNKKRKYVYKKFTKATWRETSTLRLCATSNEEILPTAHRRGADGVSPNLNW